VPYASTSLRGLLAAALVWACGAVNASGQDRLRFATPVNTAYQPPTNPITPTPGAPAFGTNQVPNAALGQGITPFDPYATAPAVPYTVPSTTGGTPPITPYGYGSATPNPGAPSLPGGATPALPPPGSFPQSPPVMFPQTPQGYPPPPGGAPAPYGAGAAPPPYMRLVEHTGFEYAWLPKTQTGDLQINDFDFFTSLTFPNFLWGEQPLKVTPGFQLHLWDGPVLLPGLPSKAYTGYIDFGWEPKITQQLTADLHFKPYIGTDFNTFSTDSVRAAGSGAAVIWFSPRFAIKAGVDYINRADIKMLPILGVIWQPNQDMYFDISIPRPLFKWKMSTFGTGDGWWYIGGEYGGGTWTLQYPPVPPIYPVSVKSLTDINDIRIFGGFEWHHMRGVRDVKSFIEIGYVWDRHIVYVVDQSFNYDPSATLMVRAGFSL
jgi:hypothetical protein